MFKKKNKADQHIHEGTVKTDLYCHDCNKTFIARIDYDIDGNHVVECPFCGHEHCRTIKDGKVTGDRWDSRANTTKVEKRNVWKATDLKIGTTSASAFLMEKWLNFGEDN